ncbi:TPA: hypothetical protein DCL30_05085 [Candidatus Peribacteria bacterium]|nr:hypothetical protein [Candidatus Peribacteria bacterium]HAS33729.1 hypothetical protein [Candidatus Peribacteria bacterium]
MLPVMKHLVIIDGHHLMYRAYWAIPRTLKTKSGEQTNAVFGVASMLLTILAKEEPTHMLLCFDAGEETFRHQENATYKEGRAETPDDFYVQIPRVMELVDVFGFLHVSSLKYEADDFLGTYAKAGEAQGMQVTIVTGDRDALQLASERVRIAIPHKGYQQAEYLGPKEIEAKYGVRPDQIASYKGLTGDPSDNLPGVKGIGPKNASELLQHYGTLHGVYHHLADIRPAIREKLEHDREQAFFCERMAELVCDIPLPVALDDLEVKDEPSEKIDAFFARMEFSLLLKRLRTFVQSPYGAAHFLPLAGQEPSRTKQQSQDQLLLF